MQCGKGNLLSAMGLIWCNECIVMNTMLWMQCNECNVIKCNVMNAM